MKCPFCKADDTAVVDSRLSDDGDSVRRRRQTGCLDPAPHGGGQPPAFTQADLERLRRALGGHHRALNGMKSAL